MSVTQTLKNLGAHSRHAVVAGVAGVLFGFLNGLIVVLQPQPLAAVLLQDVPHLLECDAHGSMFFESDKQSCYLAFAITEEEEKSSSSSTASLSSSTSSASSARVPVLRPAAPIVEPVEVVEPVQTPAELPVVSEPEQTSNFPALGRAVYPVASVPNWGAMQSPAQWNRTFEQMPRDEYVSLPAYDMSVLTKPLKNILEDRNSDESVHDLTTKLFYSTRFFGTYNPDSGEFAGKHAGIDLKLPLGTPIRSIGGGIVHAVRSTTELGTHVIVEHRVDGKTYYAIYGHLDGVSVREGQRVQAGSSIGTVGMTGNTAAPHLHLQVDTGEANEESHTPYMPTSTPSRSEALSHAVNPILFIATHR